MKLHEDKEIFEQLQRAVADFMGLPAEVVKRDYYIVWLLARLANSPFADECVFKGGTSLSKCYPKSIKRFSEDIDLTYMAPADMMDKQCGRRLKSIEKIMSAGFVCQKNEAEHNVLPAYTSTDRPKQYMAIKSRWLRTFRHDCFGTIMHKGCDKMLSHFVTAFAFTQLDS